MSSIFDNDDISKFKPFVHNFIIIAIICTITILLVSFIIITPGDEVTSEEKLLILFNFIFIALEIGFYFIIKRGFEVIKYYYVKLNKSGNTEGMDVVFNVRNKFKFIKDAEQFINDNMDSNYALVHYDINKFTIINNSVGYKVGDNVLLKICKIFNKSLKNEIFGKAEGDNFFVLFEYEEQNELIERMLILSDKIENLNVWSKINIKPAVNTGIYFIDNEELDIRVAIDRADFAKSHLKNGCESNYAIYNESIGNNLIEVKRMEDDMHRALDNNEFKVYMQPKVNLKSGVISGAEALVRWEHPELGLLSPIKFISIFEENGFIVKLDKFVFEQVCKNLRRWIDCGYDVVPISVNVSRIHFLSSNFVTEYNDIKKKYKIPDNLVEIEITESVVFGNENENAVFAVMRNFKDYGFEISMDDFGSGYSSLGLLKEMPINTLRLDKIFLNQIEDYNSQIIVNNMVNIAKNLNINVVSEGVETFMQVDFLRDIGCDMAQGFIFSKPKHMAEYEKLINKGRKNYYNVA
ncbi:MAG: GGDEF domain-containing phosphodiesterase [Sedimentibacter sp.]|uniref:putative bifunctional diguanylate cyclase/phosphodiesterase n=1 Tax=Sedimentibacter sp. TaxID=1960295 RepID=UPI002981070A|nr:GGDEF domain-containing phosphodiesterase [Sedimentibacter sp.]MDW5299819.1 GGDEF domain-containing phosphodiesterase [Sedimentibacter sp.]